MRETGWSGKGNRADPASVGLESDQPDRDRVSSHQRVPDWAIGVRSDRSGTTKVKHEVMNDTILVGDGGIVLIIIDCMRFGQRCQIWV